MKTMQEQKAEMLAEIKAILPKGWRATMSAKYSGYTRNFAVTLVAPFTIWDKKAYNFQIVRPDFEYIREIEKLYEVNEYRLNEEFELDTEEAKTLLDVVSKVNQIVGANSKGEFDYGEQRYDSNWFYSIYLKPSKKALEETNIKAVKFSSINDEELGFVSTKEIILK